jgi:hypothetical protein
MIQVSKPIMQGMVSPLDGASSISRSMSAFGTKQTSKPRLRMSAFGCKAVVHKSRSDVS